MNGSSSSSPSSSLSAPLAPGDEGLNSPESENHGHAVRGMLSNHGMTVDLINQVTKSGMMYQKDGSVYRHLWFDISGSGMAPWEVHRPQQVLMQLAKKGLFRNKRVLDLGCGIGDMALYLARYCQCDSVTAVDLVPRAIEFAQSKESLRPGMRGRVRWMVADVADEQDGCLQGMTFDLLWDCATWGSISDQEQVEYMKTVDRVCEPGGTLIICGISDKWHNRHRGAPRRLTPALIHAAFNPATGWRVESVEDTYLEHHPSINYTGEISSDPVEWEYVWRGYAESIVAIIRKLAPQEQAQLLANSNGLSASIGGAGGVGAGGAAGCPVQGTR